MFINKPAVASPDESSEITLRLEQYDDIFSDFDIRPYSKRALSVDFLDEIKRATRDKADGKIELILLVPKKHRNERDELTIRERLAAHFKKHHAALIGEKRRIQRNGVRMVVAGIVCMLGATLVLSRRTSGSFLSSFLVIFLEPAAWFLLWEGMDEIIFTSRGLNSELDFYHKMADAHERVRFKTY